MLGSMESLMSSSALENLSEIEVDSNKELIGQGVGNIAASLLGSISSAGSIIRSHANIKGGGRRRLSGVLCSAIMLLCIWTSAPVIGKIPLSIFAGVIISVGLTLFDTSILRSSNSIDLLRNTKRYFDQFYRSCQRCHYNRYHQSNDRRADRDTFFRRLISLSKWA